MRFVSKIALVGLAVTLIASYASATVINGEVVGIAGGPAEGQYSGQAPTPTLATIIGITW